MSFGCRKAITDKYGKPVEVDVDEGDADVCLSVWADAEGHAISAIAPDQADDLAAQLRAAAAYARTREPHS